MQHSLQRFHVFYNIAHFISVIDAVYEFQEGDPFTNTAFMLLSKYNSGMFFS